MTHAVSNLIRANVHPRNAKKLEQECHSELCRAHASGDLSDVQALRGKIAICRQVREDSIDRSKISLAQILQEMQVLGELDDE